MCAHCDVALTMLFFFVSTMTEYHPECYYLNYLSFRGSGKQEKLNNVSVLSLLTCCISISASFSPSISHTRAAYLQEESEEWEAGAEELGATASVAAALDQWEALGWGGWEPQQDGDDPSTWKWNLCVASAGEKDRSTSLTRTSSTAQPKHGTGETRLCIDPMFTPNKAICC